VGLLITHVLRHFLILRIKAAGCRWLMPTIPATQEAKIRRVQVQSQPRQTVCETLSQKNPTQKRAGVAQGEGPEFKLQYHKEKRIKALNCWHN
jgi:hypothetical protein